MKRNVGTGVHQWDGAESDFNEKVTGSGRDGAVGTGPRGDGCAGYLSVERGGVGESGWEGRRQLRRVQWV